MSAHSPAPWYWDNGSLYSRSSVHLAAIIDQEGCRVFRDAPLAAWQAEIEADRRLIKAAPTLAAAIEEALEFLSGQEDVVDGDYGQPAPNKAMQLGNTLRDALRGAGISA